jgi:hypothetical protein
MAMGLTMETDATMTLQRSGCANLASKLHLSAGKNSVAKDCAPPTLMTGPASPETFLFEIMEFSLAHYRHHKNESRMLAEGFQP